MKIKHNDAFLSTQNIFTQFSLRYPTISLSGHDFIVNSTVFDLDPKLYPHHFAKYVKKTKDSFNAYKQHRNADPSR